MLKRLARLFGMSESNTTDSKSNESDVAENGTVAENELKEKALVLFSTFMETLSSVQSEFDYDCLQKIANDMVSDDLPVSDERLADFLAGFGVGACLELVAMKRDATSEGLSGLVKSIVKNKKRKTDVTK